jgi:hypothetical protein
MKKRSEHGVLTGSFCRQVAESSQNSVEAHPALAPLGQHGLPSSPHTATQELPVQVWVALQVCTVCIEQPPPAHRPSATLPLKQVRGLHTVVPLLFAQLPFWQDRQLPSQLCPLEPLGSTPQAPWPLQLPVWQSMLGHSSLTSSPEPWFTHTPAEHFLQVPQSPSLQQPLAMGTHRPPPQSRLPVAHPVLQVWVAGSQVPICPAGAGQSALVQQAPQTSAQRLRAPQPKSHLPLSQVGVPPGGAVQGVQALGPHELTLLSSAQTPWQSWNPG